MFVRSPFYFAPDDEGGAAPIEGGEPAEVAPVEGAPAGEVEPGTEAAPTVEEEPVEVDWSAKVTEWGGEDAVAEALALRQALSTREGVTELFRQAAAIVGVEEAKKLLGITDAQAADLGAEPEPSIEELLADEERVVTAADIKRILEHERQQQRQQTEQQRQAQTILSTIDSTFVELKIEDEEDRISILTLADQLVPADRIGDPAAVAQAIRTAHARFDAKVKAAAEAIIKGKAEVHEQLPSPLPTGGGGGTGTVEGEPMTVKEAKERARKQLGIE